jgi:hypothetical protein
MRYFSDALEDRRVLIRSATNNPVSQLPNIPRATTVSSTQIPLPSLINPNSSRVSHSDSFTTSNHFEISSSVSGGSTAAWTGVGAKDLSPEMRAHIEKFGETPTYVGKDGKVHVDREKLIQRVVDYYAGPEGGLKGFSVQGFMAAGHDERMAMLRSMREQNDAAKAAKFEEDLRLAKERDAAKAANNNQVTAAGNPLGKVIATLGTLATAFIPKGSSS